MSDNSQSQSSARQSQLDQVLADYLNSVESGPELDRQSLIDANPDVADDLRSFFRNRDAMERIAEPFKAAIDAPTLVGLSQSVSAFTGTTIRYFGDYELLEEIARGGMGVVYKARQVNLNRIVALKMILAGQLAGDSEVKRFYAEAEAAASLDHPGIVPIFEIGQHEDQHYFSMAYIEGISLAKKVADGPLPPRDAADLVKKVTEAVQYAHEKGIIHRDLKPANVLLDSAGLPRVTDFGLAKQLGGESELTGTGQVLGTPSYMPPEQAAGNLDQIGPASDVYSLGAILYCLLTGRPAFQSANPVGTLKQVLEQEPVSPSQLNPQIPRDLETICLKCLEKSAMQRYASAQELADELGRFLNGEPILVRPVSVVERTWRWCRRQPLVAGLIGAVAVSLLIGTLASTYFAILANRQAMAEISARRQEQLAREQAQTQQKLADAQRLVADDQRQIAIQQRTIAVNERDAKDQALIAAKQERDQKEQARAAAEKAKENEAHAREEADRHRVVAEQAREQAETALYFNRASLAYQYWLDDNLPQSRRMLDACPPARRGWEWRYLDRLHHGDLLTLPGNGQFTTGLQFSADGKRLAASSRSGAAGVSIWDLTMNKPISEINQVLNQRQFCANVLSQDGKIVALGERSGAISLWDAETGKLIREFIKLPQAIGSLTFSPDGKWLAAAGSDGRNGEQLLAFTEPPRNEYLIVWDVASGQEVFRPKGHGVAAMFSPDGTRLLTFKVSTAFRITPTVPDLFMALFDITGWAEVAAGKLGSASSFSFSGDGKRLALGGQDRLNNTRFVSVFDPATGEKQLSIPLDRSVGDIALSPDGKFLTVAEHLGTSQIDVWDLKQRRRVRGLRGHNGMINSLTYAPNGHLASSSWDFTIKFWDPATSQQVHRLGGGGFGQAEQAKFSPDGAFLAFAQPNTVSLLTGPIQGITLLNAGTGRAARTLGGHASGPTRLAFSQDGLRLASGGRRGDVKVWEAASGKEICSIKGLEGEVSALAISPDGRWCASAHEPPVITRARFGEVPFQVIPVSVKVWDVLAGKERLALAGHPGGVYQVAFSPDGRFVASAGHPLIKIWDLETGAMLRDFNQQELKSGINDHFIFSPNGQILATAGSGSVQFWDVVTGKSVAVLQGHGNGRLDGVAFSPDGLRLATASVRDVKLWDVRTGQEVLTLPLTEPGTEESAAVAALTWSTDGKRLRAALRDGAVLEWNGDSQTP